MNISKLWHKITRTEMFGRFHKTSDISVEYLTKHNIKGLILDVDNTLTTHDNGKAAAGIPEWAEKLRNHGVKLIILSNNNEKRVKPFAESLGMDFVCDVVKPGKKGYELAMKKLKMKKENVAAVGDQIFTDVWGANNFGIKMLFVEPIQLESWKKQPQIRIKRIFEKLFI